MGLIGTLGMFATGQKRDQGEMQTHARFLDSDVFERLTNFEPYRAQSVDSAIENLDSEDVHRCWECGVGALDVEDKSHHAGENSLSGCCSASNVCTSQQRLYGIQRLLMDVGAANDPSRASSESYGCVLQRDNQLDPDCRAIGGWRNQSPTRRLARAGTPLRRDPKHERRTLQAHRQQLQGDGHHPCANRKLRRRPRAEDEDLPHAKRHILRFGRGQAIRVVLSWQRRRALRQIWSVRAW